MHTKYGFESIRSDETDAVEVELSILQDLIECLPQGDRRYLGQVASDIIDFAKQPDDTSVDS